MDLIEEELPLPVEPGVPQLDLPFQHEDKEPDGC